MRKLPGGRAVIFKDVEFNFSFADTGLDLMRGLGSIDNLSPYDGMLFDFGCDFNIHMWAKNLLFPVEVVFLDESGVILQIGYLDPGTEHSFILKASIPSRYALEVPLGFLKEHCVKIGDKFEIKGEGY